MSYINLNLENLVELKSRRGSTTTGIIATILGLNYPVTEAYSVYLWVESSTATPDDVEVVASDLGDPNTGRWIRIDLAQIPQVNPDWNSSTGPSAIMNKPATFPTTSAQISDSTATGRALIVALNQAAGRAAIGAGIPISLTTTGTGAASLNTGTGALNIPTPTAPASAVQAAATRALNSAFQVSATRNAIVFYSVQITVTASISGGQDGDLFLEIASDSAFTTNVQTVSVAPGSQSYSLAVALQGIQKGSLNVSGFVPSGYYARLRTVNNTGTPAYSYRAGQEVQL